MTLRSSPSQGLEVSEPRAAPIPSMVAPRPWGDPTKPARWGRAALAHQDEEAEGEWGTRPAAVPESCCDLL